MKSLHTSQVAHQAGAYPGFCSMNRLEIFLLPSHRKLVHPSHRRANLLLKYSWNSLFRTLKDSEK